MKNSRVSTKFLSIVILCSYLQAGVEVSTMIETSHGKKYAHTLQIGDYVACMSQNGPVMKEITSIEDVVLDTIIEITTQDDVVLRVSPNQSLFIPYKWISADQVSLGDMLVTKDKTFIGIKSISRINTPYMVRFFNVADHHNFFAAPNGVLIHNGPYTAYVVYCATKASLIAAAVAGTTYVVVQTGGMALTAGGAVLGGTATVGGTVVGAGAGTAHALITGATLGTGSGAFLGGAGVVLGTEGTLATTAILSGASVGVALETTAIAGAAATSAGTAGAVTLTAAVAASIEAASVSASMAFFLCPWCP